MMWWQLLKVLLFKGIDGEIISYRLSFQCIFKSNEKRGKFLKKLWCCVGGRGNLVLTTEL